MIPASDFDYLRHFLHEQSAIVLEPDKQYLVEARLAQLTAQQGLDSVSRLIEQMRWHDQDGLGRKVLEAMTNNETWFFRDLLPFEALKFRIIPDLIALRANERRISVWSAACSTGQEPYSIALTFAEHFPDLRTWNLQIQATDINQTVLDRARVGRYSQLEIGRGLPAFMLAKYFRRQALDWELSSGVRSMVRFQLLNLAQSWPGYISADIIFLRNVLIYFDVETKREILRRVRNSLRPDGYLLLGGAETTINLDDGFERVQVGAYSWYRLKP